MHIDSNEKTSRTSSRTSLDFQDLDFQDLDFQDFQDFGPGLDFHDFLDFLDFLDFPGLLRLKTSFRIPGLFIFIDLINNSNIASVI